MTQCAGIHFDSRNFPVGVTDQPAARLAEALQFIPGEKAPVRKNVIKRLHTMPFAENKPIPQGPVGAERIHPHDMVIEGNQIVRFGQSTADMALLSPVDHPADAPANLQCFLRQKLAVHKILLNKNKNNT